MNHPSAKGVFLRLVKNVADVRQNITVFNTEAQNASALAISLLRTTRYWVFDPESGNFGPSKFIGFAEMDFQRYQSARNKKRSGTRFDGNITRRAIEAAIGNSYSASRSLSERLRTWAEALFGPAVFEDLATIKWKFVRLPATRSYWAVLANPKFYRIEDAIREQIEDDWTVQDSDVKAGDRLAIWKAKADDRNRGVIAFAEVLSNPAVLGVPASRHAYYLNKELLVPRRRVKIKYVKPPNLPLWLEKKGNERLKELSVARASGGTVFKITPEQWLWLVDAAGGWPLSETLDDEDVLFALVESRIKKPVGGQGFSLDPKIRKSVEQHAVDLAKEHFKSEGYTIKVVGKPYDLHCTKLEKTIFVEVKGTQTLGEEILLTPNEVRFAETNSNQMALFVVRNVRVSKKGQTPKASGGDIVIKYPWKPVRERLSPIGFTYELEPLAASQTPS